MKICEYCGSQSENDVTECPNCGAKDFLYVCRQCGKKFKDVPRCPDCGTHVDAKMNRCPHCSTIYYSATCPNCGYDPGPYQQEETAAPQTEPKHRHLALWVLGWIFFFPAPLTVLILRSKKLATPWKVILVVIVWIAFFAILGAGAEDTETDDTFEDVPETEIVTETEEATADTEYAETTEKISLIPGAGGASETLS